MTLRRITGPSTLPVTVAEAKAYGRRNDHDEEDVLIEAAIWRALALAEAWCSRAFEPQVWEQVLDRFPAAEIELGLDPVQSVTSVKYDDAEGVEQTVPAEDYEVDALGGWVVPSAAWPTPLEGINTVRVRFVAGGETPEDVKQAILQLTEHWLENRSGEPAPAGVYRILGSHRRMFV